MLKKFRTYFCHKKLLMYCASIRIHTVDMDTLDPYCAAPYLSIYNINNA